MNIGKYLKVVDTTTPNRKTKCYDLYNLRQEYLGRISYNPKWRKFCFYPDINTSFDYTCLEDISMFLEELDNARKNKRT